MKKKITLVLIVVVMLLTFFAGCGIIELNEQRDYEQAAITVNYNGLTGTVSKGEFTEYFNQTWYIYYQYYGWSVDKIMEEAKKSLSFKELVLIDAKVFYADLFKISKDELAKSDFDIMKLLSADEKDYVIKKANKQFDDGINELIKEIKEDEKLNEGEKDKEEDKDVAVSKDEPRPVRPKKEEDTAFKPNSDITEENLTEKFPASFAKKDKTTYEKKAWEKLQKNLIKQYKDYDYFLKMQVEQRIIEKYEEHIKTIEGANYDAQIAEKYNYILSQNMVDYIDQTAYATAIESKNDILFHANSGYTQVKSILLKFNAEQTAVFENLKKVYNTDSQKDALIKLRNQLAVGTGKFEDTLVDCGVKVNISNPDYDATAECEVKDCPCKDCVNHANYKKEEICELDVCTCKACVNNMYKEKDVPFTTVLGYISKDMNDAIAKIKKDGVVAFDYSRQVALAKMDVFEKWMYLVNDDPGMFKEDTKHYTITPEGEESSYVEEFTALGRALGKKGIGASGLNQAEATAIKADYFDSNITYVVNDFGIHIIMVVNLPVDTVNQADKITAVDYKGEKIDDIANFKGKVYYKLSLDYITSYEDNKTVKQLYFDSVKKFNETEKYSKWQKEFTDANATNFKYKESIFKKIAETAQKQIDASVKQQGQQ
ncbi:MAG: hypothetical protein RR123_00225 [Clostridia bacterium]